MFTLVHLREDITKSRLLRNPNLDQKWNFTQNLHLKVKVFINCPSKLKLLEFRNNPQNIRAHILPEYLRISGAVSLRTATSLMLTDVIGRLQIGFTTVEAGDFPNGLRCNRQILYIRVCHSAHHQISSFPAHRKTGMIKLLFPGIHVLHMNEKAVFISIRSFNPSARLASSPPPSPSTVNKCGHLGRLVVCFVYNLLPSSWLK